MSERVTFAMLDNAMEYLAELLGVTFHKHGNTTNAHPGDITYVSHPQRSGRYYFGIYRFQALNENVRGIGVHQPEGYKSYNKRELHEALRFMANAIYAHRGILARAEEMGER